MSTDYKRQLPVLETHYVPRNTAHTLASLCQRSGRPHNLAEVAGVLELAIEVGGAYIVSVRGDNWITGNIATDEEIKRLIENCSRPVESTMSTDHEAMAREAAKAKLLNQHATDYTPLDLAAFEGHTPEPWFEKRHGYGTSYLVHTYIESDGGTVCGLWAPDGDKQQAANAALLAAAPQLLRERNELLAALKECATALDSYESSALIAEASALIARIEGQQ